MSKKIMHCIIKEECDIIYESGTDIEEVLKNPLKKNVVHRSIDIQTIYDYTVDNEGNGKL